MDLAQAYADLQRRDTGARFYIHPSYYEEVYSQDYYSWWTKINTPYLSQSVENVHQTTRNKNELLREVVYIIDHLRRLCKFVPGAIEILGVTDNSCTNGNPSVSSCELFGKKRPQKSNKRTPNDQSPATANSRD